MGRRVGGSIRPRQPPAFLLGSRRLNDREISAVVILVERVETVLKLGRALALLDRLAHVGSEPVTVSTVEVEVARVGKLALGAVEEVTVLGAVRLVAGTASATGGTVELAGTVGAHASAAVRGGQLFGKLFNVVGVGVRC
jgi:hypothetical protein